MGRPKGGKNNYHSKEEKIKILAICKGENERLAKEAGADFVGDFDMIQKMPAE